MKRHSTFATALLASLLLSVPVESQAFFGFFGGGFSFGFGGGLGGWGGPGWWGPGYWGGPGWGYGHHWYRPYRWRYGPYGWGRQIIWWKSVPAGVVSPSTQHNDTAAA